MKKHHQTGNQRGKPAYRTASSFQRKVYQVVKRIPRGKVMTYKEVAQKAGFPKAYRAVGNVLRKNYNPQIPCHRVIRSDGRIGNYNRGGEKEKMKLLKKEGYAINQTNRKK